MEKQLDATEAAKRLLALDHTVLGHDTVKHKLWIDTVSKAWLSAGELPGPEEPLAELVTEPPAPVVTVEPPAPETAEENDGT